MQFDWREFLIVAHESRNDPRESVRRTCLGRIYYYVYHLGLSKAQLLNWQDPKQSSHKALWSWFQGYSDPDIKKLGVLGSRIYSSRIDSDYRAHPLSSLMIVSKRLRNAREFELLVAKSNGQTPPTALTP